MIPFFDLKTQYETIGADLEREVLAVLRSGSYILGEPVERFEQAFAAYCGVRHGIGVDNGTNSLTLALKAMGLQPGDEVITVSNTAVPTVCAIVNAGCVPRFVDIERDTYLMDVDRIEACITPRTRCLLPVHLYGQNVAMERVLEIAQRHGLKVL